MSSFAPRKNALSRRGCDLFATGLVPVVQRLLHYSKHSGNPTSAKAVEPPTRGRWRNNHTLEAKGDNQAGLYLQEARGFLASRFVIVRRPDFICGLNLGGRGWSDFAKPRGFIRKASVQPRPPNPTI